MGCKSLKFPTERLFAGGHRGVVTPVPIPNTEVKGSIAEGSAGLARARVGRRRLFYFFASLRGGFSFSWWRRRTPRRQDAGTPGRQDARTPGRQRALWLLEAEALHEEPRLEPRFCVSVRADRVDGTID